MVGTCACVSRKGFRLERGRGPIVVRRESTIIGIALTDVYSDSLRVGRNDIPHTIPNVAIKRRVIKAIRRVKDGMAGIGPKSEMAIGIRAFYKSYFFYGGKFIGGYASGGNK